MASSMLTFMSFSDFSPLSFSRTRIKQCFYSQAFISAIFFSFYASSSLTFSMQTTSNFQHREVTSSIDFFTIFNEPLYFYLVLRYYQSQLCAFTSFLEYCSFSFKAQSCLSLGAGIQICVFILVFCYSSVYSVTKAVFSILLLLKEEVYFDQYPFQLNLASSGSIYSKNPCTFLYLYTQLNHSYLFGSTPTLSRMRSTLEQ